MIISNYRDQVLTGKNAMDWVYTALVDVTTGFLWWKKTRTEKITKSYARNWYFVSNGKYTPGWVVEELARSYEAKLKG